MKRFLPEEIIRINRPDPNCYNFSEGKKSEKRKKSSEWGCDQHQGEPHRRIQTSAKLKEGVVEGRSSESVPAGLGYRVRCSSDPQTRSSPPVQDASSGASYFHGPPDLARWANTGQFIVGVSARRPGTVRPMVERPRSESRGAPGNTAARSACNGRDMTLGSPAFRRLKACVCRTPRTAALS